MQFSVKRADLLPALKRCRSLIDRRSTLDVLKNVCLSLSTEELEVYATNLESSLIEKIPIKLRSFGGSDKEGREYAVNARKFYDIVHELSDLQPIEIKSVDASLEIRQAKAFFKLVGIDPKEFPPTKPLGEECFVPIDTEALKAMVSKTHSSTLKDETRHYLSGVFFKNHAQNSTRMVATDGFRLSYVEKPFRLQNETLDHGVIIPRRGVLEIRDLLEGLHQESELKLFVNKQTIVLQAPSTRLSIRLVEGDYPEYERLVPAAGGRKSFLVEREPFFNALKRVALMATKSYCSVNFAIEGEKLRISFSHPSAGEAEDELEIVRDTQEGGVRVGFNPHYVLEAVSLIEDQKVKVSLESDSAPGVFTPGSSDDHKCIVMPVHS